MPGENIQIVNVMEEIVFTKTDIVMRTTDMCKCDRCRADVKTLALNSLPTKYVATDGGNVFMHTMSTSTQMQAEIMVAIVEAVEIVRKRPNHAVENKKADRKLSVYGDNANQKIESIMAEEVQRQASQQAEPIAETAPQQTKEEALAAAMAAAKEKAAAEEA